MPTFPHAASANASIRTPIVLRIYIVAFLAVWSGFLSIGFVLLLIHGSPVALVPALMLAFGLTLGYRMFRLSVVADEHGLTVRNYYTTKRLAKSDIEEFRIGRASNQPMGKTIHILLQDKEILSIDAASRVSITDRGKRRLTERLTNLETWLSDT